MSGPLILVIITVALIVVSPFSDLACRILERVWRILKSRLPDGELPVPPRPPFDVRAARRHAHSLGLPFPEADGSVSWPGDGAALPDQLVHDRLHARRALAEAATREADARRALVDALDLTAGQRTQMARIRATVSCETCNGAGFVLVRFADRFGDEAPPTKVRCGDCLAKRS